MGLKEDLDEMSMRLGADLFGVASVDDLNDAPLGHRPMDILPNAKSVIVLGMKMLDAQTDILPTDGDYFGASPRQDMFKGHNTFISQELDRVGICHSEVSGEEGFQSLSSDGFNRWNGSTLSDGPVVTKTHGCSGWSRGFRA